MKKVLLAVFVCGVGVMSGMLAFAVDSKDTTKVDPKVNPPLSKEKAAYRSPYPASETVKGITWLTEQHKYPNCSGDTWSTTWADDGHVYAVGDDTGGVAGQPTNSNLAIYRIEGTPPNHSLHLVSSLPEYGHVGEIERSDTWKGAGLISVDEERWGKGNYGPSIPSAWFEEGGKRMWMIYAGCWSTEDYSCLVRKLELKSN